MTKNSLLALAAIVLLAVGLTYISSHQRQRKQPRIHVDALESNSSHSDWAAAFRATCPHMAFVTDEKVADYTVNAVWAPSRAKWVAWVERRDTARIYQGESPDSVQVLREGCHNIRSDVEDWAGFDPRPLEEPLTRASAPVGRYALSYHPTNYNRAFLLDTKTGAVWQLQSASSTLRGKSYEYSEFSRVSVNELYMSTFWSKLRSPLPRGKIFRIWFSTVVPFFEPFRVKLLYPMALFGLDDLPRGCKFGISRNHGNAGVLP